MLFISAVIFMICFLLLALDFVCSFSSCFSWKVRLVFVCLFVCFVCFVFRFILLPKIPLYCQKFPSLGQFSSVTQLCLTFCDPMDHSTPGLPVHHQLLELTQIHVHQVGDVIQPSHPLSPSSPPAFKPSQHQGLIKWVRSSHQVAKVLQFQLQYQSFQWTPRTDRL